MLRLAMASRPHLARFCSCNRDALVPALRAHAEESNVLNIYTDIDLPLAPVLYRMEHAGVRIDKGVSEQPLHAFCVRIGGVSGAEFRTGRAALNINSPKQLGVVALHTPWPTCSQCARQGKAISTAQDVLEQLAEHMKCRVSSSSTATSPSSSRITLTRFRCSPTPTLACTPHFRRGNDNGRLSSVNPNLQNIPIKTELGREIAPPFTAAPGTQLLSADYSQIEFASACALQWRPASRARLSEQ